MEFAAHSGDTSGVAKGGTTGAAYGSRVRGGRGSSAGSRSSQSSQAGINSADVAMEILRRYGVEQMPSANELQDVLDELNERGSVRSRSSRGHGDGTGESSGFAAAKGARKGSKSNAPSVVLPTSEETALQKGEGKGTNGRPSDSTSPAARISQDEPEDEPGQVDEDVMNELDNELTVPDPIPDMVPGRAGHAWQGELRREQLLRAQQRQEQDEDAEDNWQRSIGVYDAVRGLMRISGEYWEHCVGCNRLSNTATDLS